MHAATLLGADPDQPYKRLTFKRLVVDNGATTNRMGLSGPGQLIEADGANATPLNGLVSSDYLHFSLPHASVTHRA